MYDKHFLHEPIPNLGVPRSRLDVFGTFLLFHIVEFSAAGGEVHVLDTDKLGAHDNLVSKIEHEEDRQADVGSDERVNVPFAAKEHLEAVEENNSRDEEYSEPRGVGLERRLVRKGVAVNALMLETFVEAEVGDEDDVPCDKTGDRSDVNEPLEDGIAILADVQERKETTKSCVIC